ncbi:Cytochrome P450 monooxygenase aba1 [Pyricularia grisea]|nr:Cytochrome P450 monooxygenase aba1 [Pyricularia grisea]
MLLQQVIDVLATHWLSGTLALAAVYLATSYIINYRRLRSFPGPPLGSFSYLWIAYNAVKGRQGSIFYETMKKYRVPEHSFVRIGPNDLITDSPEVARHMSSARSTYLRSSWYRTTKLDPYGDSLLSTLDTSHHDALKAKAGRGYAGRDNKNLESDVDDQLRALVRLLERKYLSSDHGGVGDFRPVDMATTMQYFTLDSITKLAYSNAFGFLDLDTDVHGYMKAIRDVVPLIIISSEWPLAGSIFFNPLFLKMVGPTPKDESGVGKIMGTLREVVASRFGPDAKDQPDMLGSFVRNGLSQYQCEQEVMLQIVAGSDTTATALRGTLLQLCSTPKVYLKLQKEIDEAVRSGMVGEGVIPYETAKKLPYLQAVIYEGLRLNPPFTGLLMKQVPPGGDEIEGVFIPAGVRIGVSAKSIQMRQDVYGYDVDVFRPERWTECDEQTRMRMAANTELVFGYGRWMCAGKNLAFMELNKVYFELLRRFDFQVVDTKNPVKEENYNVMFHKDMFMKVTKREL